MTQVKICGITRLDDALAAVEAGADYIGFVFAPSPRRLNGDQAGAISRLLPAHVRKVGVFVDAAGSEIRRVVSAAGLDVVQLHGCETPQALGLLRPTMVWKAFRVRCEGDLGSISLYAGYVDAVLLDAYSAHAMGGTGERFDWRLAEGSVRWGIPVALAGGLTPENVGQAVRQVRPAIVDVSSGVESSPGRKDRDAIVRLIAAVREAENG